MVIDFASQPVAKPSIMEDTPVKAPAAKPPAHDNYDPSNPHYFGLPLGVIIAATISAIAVSITLLKFL
jgi:hypothetical protein